MNWKTTLKVKLETKLEKEFESEIWTGIWKINSNNIQIYAIDLNSEIFIWNRNTDWYWKLKFDGESAAEEWICTFKVNYESGYQKYFEWKNESDCQIGKNSIIWSWFHFRNKNMKVKHESKNESERFLWFWNLNLNPNNE